jgi:hypothetical protein
MNTRTRNRAFVIILVAYITVRLVALISVHSEPEIYAALAKYPGAYPHTVCYQLSAEFNDSYYAVMYALIPSIMTAPDAPCDTVLTR